MRLLEVCRARNTPIITFINKLDREVRSRSNCSTRSSACSACRRVPVHLAGGDGQALRRRVRHAGPIACASSGPARIGGGRRRNHRRPRQSGESAHASAMRSSRRESEIELVRGASPASTASVPRAARRRRCSSAPPSTTSVCSEVLDALIELAPPPGPQARRAARGRARRSRIHRRRLQDPGQHGSGAPRSRRVRARVLGPLRARHEAHDRAHRQGCATATRSRSCRSGARSLDEAYPGDIIGIPNHGVLQLGDTLTEGETLQFTGLPFFAPELFVRRRGRRSAPQQAASHGARSSSAKKARSRSSGRTTAGPSCSARSGSSSSRSSRIASSTNTVSMRASRRHATASRAGLPATTTAS